MGRHPIFFTVFHKKVGRVVQSCMNRDEKGLFLFSSYGLAWPPAIYMLYISI
ncbi:hypothetical protein HMPREF1548_05641 [Clostridium sp. KLE 1755]|nr:hypothetical protein HMPREF1548_05641 [Clostridium sp. KLE 1755]